MNYLINPSALSILAPLGALALLAMLMHKELASALPEERAQALSRALNVAILPLLLAFALVVAMRVAGILR